MARAPIEKERFLVPERTGRSEGRVFITDLATYLGLNERKLKVFAREHGLLKLASRGTARAGAPYVTEEAAMRLIAVFRTQLGVDIQNGARRARRFR